MKPLCIIMLFLSVTLSQAQTFIKVPNDTTIITEYNDGKLWAYRDINNFVVGLTCYEEKDDYGKYYQVQIFIQNLSKSPITFSPEEVTSSLQRKKDTLNLKVYTNDEFQKKIKRSQTLAMTLYGISTGINAGMAGHSTSYSTTYSSNGYAHTTISQHYDANAAFQANTASVHQLLTLGQMMDNDRTIKEQGYFKKTTIHPDEAVIGYMNIKRKKGNILTINIPINDFMYSFDWDVSKK